MGYDLHYLKSLMVVISSCNLLQSMHQQKCYQFAKYHPVLNLSFHMGWLIYPKNHLYESKSLLQFLTSWHFHQALSQCSGLTGCHEVRVPEAPHHRLKRLPCNILKLLPGFTFIKVTHILSRFVWILYTYVISMKVGNSLLWITLHIF